MKIKFFSLLLLLTVSSFGWANSTTLPSFESIETEGVSVDIRLDIEVDLDNGDEASLNHILDNLENFKGDNLTCEVTFKIKIGKGSTGVEASVTVKGDCSEVVEEAKKKIDDIRKLVGRR